MSDPVEAIRARMAKIDEKDLSDAARRWADGESPFAPEANPETLGAWRASLEIAFEAGRFLGLAQAGDLIAAEKARQDKVLADADDYLDKIGLCPKEELKAPPSHKRLVAVLDRLRASMREAGS